MLRSLAILETITHTSDRNPKSKHLYRVNIASLVVSASAACAASVVERVSHFCVLENQHTHTCGHITAPPETDLRWVALLA